MPACDTSRKLRVIGLTLGDPFSPLSRSGVNYNIFSRLKNKCHLVDACDLDLQGIRKVFSAITHFSLDRRRWGNQTHQNPWAFRVRTAMAEKRLNTIDGPIDVVYQDGAMFAPGRRNSVPFVSYHDGNVVVASRGGLYAHGAHYRGESLRRTMQQEREVYERASILFSMSDWLKQSFVKDFGVKEEKIVTVYAGPNLKPNDRAKTYDGRTILFVGSNFERKGGRVLLEAFRIVKREMPGARLLVAGPPMVATEEGITSLGPVKNKESLARLFEAAHVFVLPSFYEPFGIVFLEAFAFKTPCIGTNICAMPEIIEEGKGGFLVHPNDHRVLADRILSLLRDAKLCKDMGEYGFKKVLHTCNWDVVTNKIVAQAEALIFN